VPARELRLTAADVTAAGALDLGPMILATLAPADPSGAIVPSYVRLTTSALAGWSLEGSTTGPGPWTVALLPNVTYDVLIIPSAGNTYAPRALSVTPDLLNGPQPLAPGRALSVEARDELGKPWSGVRALLGSGTLPSTLGTTTETGSVAVRLSDAADRTWIASLSAPSDQGRYGLRTAALDLTNATRLIGSWAAHARNPLAITVLDPSGAKVVGARVRLATQAPFPKAATVTIMRSDGSSTVLDAAGTFTADAVTSAAGVATFPSVPADTFTATIYPDNGSGLSPWAITSGSVAASATTTAATVRMRARASFTGTAHLGSSCPSAPGADGPCAGLLVAAHHEQEEVDPTATIAADGSFTLPLDPLLSYELIARPGPQQVAPQTVLGTISAADAPGKVFQLPQVATVKTTVRAGGQAVAGAWVRVYCLAGARCADASLPIAEGRSDDQGRITLSLPAAF